MDRKQVQPGSTSSTSGEERLSLRAVGQTGAEAHHDIYSVGYESVTADFFRARRAATHAAFFLPHLRAGMRLLDGGCGPGTISIDLAAVVSPAEVVGIDLEPSQVDLARAQVAERGASNVRFEVADLYALPFPDESFDAVFLHGVLEHMGEPVRGLREVHRVLKRGGVLGARHADFGAFLLEPAPAPLDRFAGLFQLLMVCNGADPKAGRHQLRWLRESGFTRIEAAASFDCWTRTPAEAHQNARFLAQLVSDSAFAAQLVAAGLADRTVLERMRQGFLEWGANPDAFAAEAWGEAVAWKA
ncbi:MAG: methyltransferase domain-containing protein [Planctomycetes bacterium]|nr:methyltransferase domain-containing protein [Planctomycetota bacterium]